MKNILTQVFKYGTIDNLEAQSIPDGAAHSSLNWATKGDKIELRSGKTVIGTEDVTAGKVRGLKSAKKPNGDDIIYKVVGRKLFYYDDITTMDWVEVGTNVIPEDAVDEDISFENYESLAGTQLFINSPKGPYLKIMTANPGSYSDMYDEAKNYYGRIKIIQNRTLLFTRDKDKSARYDSYIDKAAYTTESNEKIGDGNGITKVFTGTLAFKSSGSRRTCFGVVITDGVEIFTDNYDGTLTGDKGGTGTINYTTGAFSVTFNAAPVKHTMTANTISFTDNGSNMDYLSDSAAGFVAAGFIRYEPIKITGSTDNNFTTVIQLNPTTTTITVPAGVLTTESAGDTVTVESIITASYQWEDSAITGICDFTYSATRIAGEGNFFRQDDGAGEIKNIASYNSVEFCFHTHKTWRVSVESDDNDATNIVWRNNVGISSWKAIAESGDGIYFIDDSNPDEPALRILTLSYSGDREIPRTISKNKSLKDYYFDQSVGFEFGNFILFSCRTKGSTHNDRVIVYSKDLKAFDTYDYRVNFFQVYNGQLIAGESNSNNVVELLSGITDDESNIENEWESGEGVLNFWGIKKTKRIMIEGEIAASQILYIYAKVDNGQFVKVGEISGDGVYVDKTADDSLIGEGMIGEGEIGGDLADSYYHYQREMRLPIGKFNKISYKFVAQSLGYVSVSTFGFLNIIYKQRKSISRYRK